LVNIIIIIKLDNKVMFEQFDRITSSIKNEILKKFENTRHLDKIKEIFDKNFDILNEFFLNCLEHNEQSKLLSKNKEKNNILEFLSFSLDELKTQTMQFINKKDSSDNKKDINMINFIYDDEFVGLINQLSTAIKDFFKHSRSFFSTMKNSSDSIIDQILYSKSNISDSLLQINNLTSNTNTNISKYSQKNNLISNKEKYCKEKLNSVQEKLENINDLRTNIARNIKTMENNCIKFYEEAKVIFKQMKTTRNNKLEDLANNANLIIGGDSDTYLLNTKENFANNNNNELRRNNFLINSKNMQRLNSKDATDNSNDFNTSQPNKPKNPINIHKGIYITKIRLRHNKRLPHGN